MNPRRHILLFHQAALGDFVLTWPIAMALGRVFAQSRVAYVTGHDKGRLVEDAIGIEAIHAENGWHALHGAADVPEGPVRQSLARTQFAVLFSQNPEPLFVENVRKLAGDIPVLHLRPNPPPGVHVWAHQLSQLPEGQPLQSYVRQMQKRVTERGVGGIGGLDHTVARTVLMHPGSGSPDKNWPADAFVSLANALTKAGHAVAFIFGEVERERFAPNLLKAFEATAPTAFVDDLPSLRRRLLQAGVFIGNDSGPTHLAATLGVRTIVLHGPHSDMVRWAPQGPSVRAVPFDVDIERFATSI